MKRTAHTVDGTLIDAAARAILFRGFPGCTLRHIAEQADLPLERVRTQFSRKNCLITAIVDHAAGLFTTPLDAAVTASADRERLMALLEKQLAAVDANRDVFLVAITRHFRPDEYPIVPPLPGRISRLQLYFTKLEEWIAKHLAPTKSSDAAVRAHLVGGAVLGMLMHWAARGGRRRATGYASSIAAIIETSRCG